MDLLIAEDREGDWAAKAVRDAVAASLAAVTAAGAGATIAATSGS